MHNNSLIKIEDVSKVYYSESKVKTTVLQSVNVEIYENDYTIIYGASGSGKSTLLHHIIGLEVPTSGKIIIDGTDITKLNQEKRAIFRAQYFGMIYQFWYWAKALSVWENVAIPLYINGLGNIESKEKAIKALKEVNMEAYADKKPMQLSGGEQQRVCLARALINDPKIIVADEPTGNLDTHNADQVMEMFQDLNKNSKRTIILVTHNLSYLNYATKKMSMSDGKITTEEKNQSHESESKK